MTNYGQINDRQKRYVVITEHGISQTVYATSMAQVRADMDEALPCVGLSRIMEQ